MSRAARRLLVGCTLALVAPVVGLIAGLIIGHGASPSYPSGWMSEAKLMLRSGLTNVADIGASNVYTHDQRAFFALATESLGSSQLATRAAERVEAMHPDQTPCAMRIVVEPVETSGALVVRAFGSRPEYTQKHLDAILDEFLAFRQRSVENELGLLFNRLSKESARLEKRIQDFEDQIEQFQQNEDPALLTERRNFAAESLSALREQLREMREERDMLQSQTLEESIRRSRRFDESSQHMPLFYRDNANRNLSGNQYLSALQEIALLKSQRVIKLKALEEAKHPVIRSLDAKILDANVRLAILREQSEDEMQRHIARLNFNIDALEDRADRYEIEAREAGAKLARYNKLIAGRDRVLRLQEKIADATEKLYQRRGVSRDPLSIVERASPPTRARPGASERVRMGRLGALWGLAVGLALFAIFAAAAALVWKREK